MSFKIGNKCALDVYYGNKRAKVYLGTKRVYGSDVTLSLQTYSPNGRAVSSPEKGELWYDVNSSGRWSALPEIKADKPFRLSLPVNATSIRFKYKNTKNGMFFFYVGSGLTSDTYKTYANLTVDNNRTGTTKAINLEGINNLYICRNWSGFI